MAAHLCAGTSVAVEVSNNGGFDFSRSLVVFKFVDELSIAAISPSVGPVDGGMVVSISGVLFRSKRAT